MIKLPLWLISLLVGISQISESIYTPSLPDIGKSLMVSDSMVEFTLTIYLLGFAVGVLFWGRLSDRLGRKPCMITGLIVFVLGSLGCYASTSILMLMTSRFVQAFGASIGSVLCQAACRDALKGPELGKAYAMITGLLGVFPAIGPVVGGYMAEYWGWGNIFIVLALWGAVLAGFVAAYMPETHKREDRAIVKLGQVYGRLVRDRHVWACAFIVGISNGIYFSYFAEGAFYMMELLELSPSHYGLTFLALAGSMLLGGFIGPRVQKGKSSTFLMTKGLGVMLFGAAFFAGVIAMGVSFSFPKMWLITSALLAEMMLVFGMCFVNAGALSMALVRYTDCTGTASSLFGFTYYIIVSTITFGMGVCHNDTLYAMPIYFLVLTFLLWHIRHFCDEKPVHYK